MEDKMTKKLCVFLLIVLFCSFLLVFVPDVVQATEPTRYEYNTASSNATTFLYGTTWGGQTFTVGTVGTNGYLNVTNIRLLLFRVGSPGNMNVSIRATSNGFPTGNDIASGVINANTLYTGSAGAWTWINMTAWNGNALSPNTKYAIVARATTGSLGNIVYWKAVAPGAYSGGNSVNSLDSGVTWTGLVLDRNFEVWGKQVYGYTFKGLYDEDTGLIESANARAVNVTAYFNDGTNPVTFEVNGTYLYIPITQPLFFRYNLATSSDTVSQYGLNQPVYNTSSYIDISFPEYEPDTNYTVTATLTWNSTYTVTNKATSGCRINFATPPTEDEYLSWYVHRTVAGTARIREYWPSAVENVVPDFYIFNASLSTYNIAFLDLGGVLSSAPYVVIQRLINGSYFTVEKRLVDIEKKVQINLVEGERYKVIVSDTTISYTFGDLLATEVKTITLTLRGVDFPKETILTYKYVRIYGLRDFGDPQGNITVTYQDLLNMTNSVNVSVAAMNGTVLSSQLYELTNQFVFSWLSAENDTDYQVVATINHNRYGTYSWKQLFIRSYSTNPWVLGWLGSSLPININSLVGIALIIFVGAGFSMINPEVGAFLATCTAAALTILGWLTIAPGLLITAFCLTLMFGIVMARRRVQYV